MYHAAYINACACYGSYRAANLKPRSFCPWEVRTAVRNIDVIIYDMYQTVDRPHGGMQDENERAYVCVLLVSPGGM